jgi:hypothetical protein
VRAKPVQIELGPRLKRLENHAAAQKAVAGPFGEVQTLRADALE